MFQSTEYFIDFIDFYISKTIWHNFFTTFVLSEEDITELYRFINIKKQLEMKKILLAMFAISFCSIGFSQNMMVLKTSGKVVIGDTTQISTPGNYSLYVQNGMLTERVKVSLKQTQEWSDDAFKHTPSINKVSESIEKNSHLVDMPSAASLVKNGYELKDMDAKLLAQIEWLWQHMIEMKKENENLKKAIEDLKKDKKD
jgi:hypothetical protein